MTTTILRGQSAPVGPYTVRVVRVEGQHVTLEVTGPADGVQHAEVLAAAERIVQFIAAGAGNSPPYSWHGPQAMGRDADLVVRAVLASPPPAGGEGDDGQAWRAIETAPKQGRLLLAWKNDDGGPAVEIGWWNQNYDPPFWDYERWPDRASLSRQPFAWMPLPKPPAVHDRAAGAPRRRGVEGSAP